MWVCFTLYFVYLYYTKVNIIPAPQKDLPLLSYKVVHFVSDCQCYFL